jgi:chemotaxis protein methyltransferase CheR
METVVAAGTGISAGADGYARLRRLVHERTGFDMESYKDRFIERRVAIRVRATHHQGLGDYLKYLALEREEMDRLLRCLTIHVSSFFRNASTYEAIRREVFPQLFAPGATRHPRFWSVGCSRGEEPYSLAILVHEHLGAALRGWDVQIQAIDVDDRVLAEAKAGEYGSHQVADLEPARRERFFIHQERWRLVPEIRRMVRFHRGDILMEPPGGEYDFILCRNLLIYLDRPGQEAVLERFARSLRPGGFLVLGRTEVFVGASREAFEVVDPRERIYRRLRGDEPAFSAGVAFAPHAAHGGKV